MAQEDGLRDPCQSQTPVTRRPQGCAHCRALLTLSGPMQAGQLAGVWVPSTGRCPTPRPWPLLGPSLLLELNARAGPGRPPWLVSVGRHAVQPCLEVRG